MFSRLGGRGGQEVYAFLSLTSFANAGK
jgi:hypothetical protein